MRILMVLVFVIVLSACDKDDTIPDIDWDTFKTGVVHTDKSTVEKVIPQLLVNTYSKPTDNDMIGQKTNIDMLIRAINKSNVLSAELFCYACIETYPAQSEITITTDSSGISISRIIDILTPKDNILKFVNIHATY